MSNEIKKSEDYRIISLVVNSTRLVSDREEILRKKGYHVAEKSMGAGGKLQIKGNRIQIGYGHGKYNYAKAVIL